MKLIQLIAPLLLVPLCIAAGSVNIILVGDVGFNGTAKETRAPNQERVASAMAEYVRSTRLKLDAVIIPGDVFKVKLKSTSDQAFQLGFEQMYDANVLNAPFYTVLGNHDYDSGAAAVELKYAKDHPESRWKTRGPWYRVDLPQGKPIVSILMLDSMKDKLSSADWKKQKAWMEAELAKPRNGAWMVCCAHKPFTSDGQHGDSQTIKSEFGPLLKKYDVGFYLAGHDHVLQHARVVGWKTDFIISGGGGENVNRPVNGHQAEFVKASAGFVHIEFGADTAKVKMIDAAGDVLYAFDRPARQ